MSDDSNEKYSRSTRLVCARLYEGGLLNSYNTLNSIKQKPFKGKSPEFELDIDLITKHAEVTFRRHMIFNLIIVAFSFLGFIFYGHAEVSSIFLISAICLISFKLNFERNTAIENFSRKRFNPDYNLDNPSNDDIITKLCKWIIQDDYKLDHKHVNDQNIVVFGDYFPFLGSGQRVGYWNFVIDSSKRQSGESNNKDNCNVLCEGLQKPLNEEEYERNLENLSIKELYERVYIDINKKNLPVSLEYILYADGKEIDRNKFLLEDVSKIRTFLENVDPFSENHNEDTFKDYRTYLLLRYHDKARSTLSSTFLRFSKVGKNFFTECSFYVLTPINENVYNIDKLPINSNLFTFKVGLATLVLIAFIIKLSDLSGLFSLILLVFSALPLILILYHRIIINERKTDTKRIKRGEPHNYGVIKTFRETIASLNYKNYFSAQDILMIHGSIEKSIINSIADLLDAKGLDSSFLRENMMPFVNNGIIMSGGTMNNSPVVSGSNNLINQAKNQIQQKISVSKEVKT